jgi:hypothetical protein
LNCPAEIVYILTYKKDLLYPVYIITYFEMGAAYRFVEACHTGEPPEDWRIFLVFILISVILFCITSAFSGVATHLFSTRRNSVLGLKWD